jgi:hypothetical protein
MKFSVSLSFSRISEDKNIDSLFQFMVKQIDKKKIQYSKRSKKTLLAKQMTIAVGFEDNIKSKKFIFF